MNVTMPLRKMLVLALLLLISSFFLAQKSKSLPEPKIRALLPANALAEYPDLALAGGAIAIVYQQMDEPQEIIVLSMYRDGVWVDSLVLDRADIVYRPRLTVSPEGTLWVSWARKNQNAIEVVVLPVNEGRPGQMEVVSTGSARNWWQAMACDAKGLRRMGQRRRHGANHVQRARKRTLEQAASCVFSAAPANAPGFGRGCKRRNLVRVGWLSRGLQL